MNILPKGRGCIATLGDYGLVTTAGVGAAAMEGFMEDAQLPHC